SLLSSKKGILYAHLVLLFNRNPHFLNVIHNRDYSGSDTETYDDIFRRYVGSLDKGGLRRVAEELLLLYDSPSSFSPERIRALEQSLESYTIIAKFVMQELGYDLDYCIYGKRTRIELRHPFLLSSHVIYNIQPIIHYDEFYSSNSTFYHDLIYIDINEVQNDADIIKKILHGRSTSGSYYVGANVNDNMKVCLKKAFKAEEDVESEIRRIFIIHEMTHKILNNRFNYYNRIVEEELAIASTIYANPYLGLSVCYSYLNYPYVHSPHRIAALKFLRFVAEDTGDSSYLYSPSRIKSLSADQLRLMAYRYFYNRMELVDADKKNESAFRKDISR
ncbi:MAG: hypothetical protein ACOC2H_08155, partial [Spirochaetota bacterium]